MSTADLEAVIDRAMEDRRFHVLVTHSVESLCADYALSADEIDALRTHDHDTLVRLGLDDAHANLATRLL